GPLLLLINNYASLLRRLIPQTACSRESLLVMLLFSKRRCPSRSPTANCFPLVSDSCRGAMAGSGLV
ncbi:unnamed protein product, partial [Gadus morhua 'NCC']